VKKGYHGPIISPQTGQRQQNASQEAPMRTPKPLYAQQRLIYHPEWLSCPSCGDLLVGCNYLKWDKLVQTLDQVLSIASRPGHCPNPECPGHALRLLSAQGQGIAPANSTYGYDVVARIGWLRQHRFDTYEQIHADLTQHVSISASPVRALYPRSYLPLLACHERSQRGRLDTLASEQGGLIIALDGLEPEAGEPQLWCIRELSTGLTLRSGWLSRQTQDAFEDFLDPLAKLGWPILAVLSDKQTGLQQAVASKLPKSPHQLCQAHYLRNLATPLSEADVELKTQVRKAVRDQVGALIRRPVRSDASAKGVLTVTGILASPLPWAAADAGASGGVEDVQRQVEEVISYLFAHTRYLLTLKGRPPFNLAGLETYERLHKVVEVSFKLLTHRLDWRLVTLYQGLQTALAPFAPRAYEIDQGAVWLRDIADILGLPGAPAFSSTQVAGWLQGYLGSLVRQDPESELLTEFALHLNKVSDSYWPGLFHCYEVEGLARTNNDLESHFRDLQHRLLRTTGNKGGTRRALHRVGAWELLKSPPSEPECLDALRHIPDEDLADERQRIDQHRQRFRFEMRSIKSADAQLGRLLKQWLTLPKS
jgi:Transposase, Mutator family